MQLCQLCLHEKLYIKSGASLPTPFTLFDEKSQTHIRVYRPVTVDLWFLFNNVCMQLICLLPFSFSFFCLFSLYKPLFRRQGAYCWVPNNVLPLTDSRVWGRAYSMMVTYFARFVFTFCIEWYCGSFFWDVRCHFASHACLLVASCCLPDPLNAPQCSYVDMAPSAVGHCPFCVSSEVRFVITSVLNLTDYTSNSKAVG